MAKVFADNVDLNLLGSEPFLVLNQTEVVNDNNGNGQLDPGENAGIAAYITNCGTQAATDVQGTLRTTSPYITIADSVYQYGTINAGASANNAADPYVVDVDVATPSGSIADFELVLFAAETTWTRPFSLQIGIAAGTVMWGPKALSGFPSAGFVYGCTYDPIGDQLFVCNAYSRLIYKYSSDSAVTFLGTMTAPDTNLADIDYSAYDDKLWVCGYTSLKRVWKISKTGAVQHFFPNPASDYGCGLAFDGENLWLADRRTSISAPKYIYISDTLGSANQYTDPVQGYYSARCLAYDEAGQTFIHVNTFFNSGGTALDSAGLYEIEGIPPTQTGNRFIVPTGWNIRGVGYDPRDGNYWITIPQGGPVPQAIVKVKGFHDPVGVIEQESFVSKRACGLNAYPNPAASQVSLNIKLSRNEPVNLKIYDAAGRLIRTLSENTSFGKGSHTLSWNLKDANSKKVAGGVYFLVLETACDRISKKIVIAR